MIRSWKYKTALAWVLRALSCLPLILSITILLTAFATVGPKPADAARKSCGTQIKEAIIALNADTQGTFITENEKEQIQRLFEDPKTSPYAANYVFHLLMDKRLANLPPKDAEQIKSIIESTKVDKSSGVSGRYKYDSRSVIISLPESYHGSIVEFFIKTHEIEHAIQDRVSTGKLGKESFSFFRKMLNSFDSQMRFLEEAGAMQAEWQYLQALPTRAKQSIADDIERNTQFNESEKDFLTRTLTSDAWTANDHTEIEWRAGRYSLYEIESQNRSTKTGLSIIGLGGLGAISIQGIAATAMIESFCQKLLNQSVMLPDGQFYQKICLRFQSIQEQQSARFPISQPSLPTKRHD